MYWSDRLLLVSTKSKNVQHLCTVRRRTGKVARLKISDLLRVESKIWVKILGARILKVVVLRRFSSLDILPLQCERPLPSTQITVFCAGWHNTSYGDRNRSCADLRNLASVRPVAYAMSVITHVMAGWMSSQFWVAWMNTKHPNTIASLSTWEGSAHQQNKCASMSQRALSTSRSEATECFDARPLPISGGRTPR